MIFSTPLDDSQIEASGSLSGLTYGDAQHQGWILADEKVVDDMYQAYQLEFQSLNIVDTPLRGFSPVILGRTLARLDLLRDQFVLVARLSGEQVFAAEEKLTHASHFGLYRKHIFGSVKRTLRRLQLDYIDVLQFDGFDRNTPLAEVMQALHDVVQAGYVRYVEISGSSAWQSRVMQKYARANHLTTAISFHNHSPSTFTALFDDVSDTESSLSSSPVSDTLERILIESNVDA
ncbi:hypothetical protein FRC12_000504 [Ceratobasidium sp. 428]|nr:hypothetical protein FRC09_012006 [Ceratobasidium sp. 395]KAG8777180.1 hypothetical protein FRC12_000504 [Ceratobasidium sp. 428]